MRIYLVIGAFGDGGITTAIFGRAAMLRDAGHDCAIVHLDYRPDLPEQLAALRDGGRLRSDVPVLGPYLSLSGEGGPAAATGLPAPEFVAWRQATAPRPTRSLRRFAGAVRRRLRGRPVSRTPGERSVPRALEVGEPGSARFTRMEFAPSGWKAREVVHRGGAPVAETYFSASGLRQVTRVLKNDGARIAGVYARRPGRTEEYFSSNHAWHVRWLTELARSRPDRPLFLCDGPGSAAKVTGIAPDAAARVLVVHDNHYAEEPFARGGHLKSRTSFIQQIAKVDGLLVLTEEQAADIVAEVGHPEKVFVLPNTVVARPVCDVERIPQRVAMFGRLIDRKGVEDAIEAFVTVVRSHPDAVLDIYGNGPARPALQAQIDSLDLGAHVTLRGYCKQPAQEMARSALVAFPSRSEAFPLAVLEALMQETPVVAYACKYGPADQIESGSDGMLVAPRDVSGLAEAIVQLLDNPAISRLMGEAGRRKVLASYTEEPMQRRWSELLAALTQDTASRMAA